MATPPNITLPLKQAGIESSAGQPHFSVHEVVAGDNLWNIANGHGISYEALLEFNLSYNFASLTEFNPDLIYLLTLQNEQNFDQVPITLHPGQAILIPEITDPCYETLSSNSGQPVSVASCALGDAEAHFDPIYVYNDPRYPMNHYINAKDDEDLQGVLIGIRNRKNNRDVTSQPEKVDRDISFLRATEIMKNKLVRPLKQKVIELYCGITDFNCTIRQTRLWWTIESRQTWIDENFYKYDTDGNGSFSEQELTNAITACEMQKPIEE